MAGDVMYWWQVDEDGESSDDESHATARSLKQNEGSQSRPSAGNELHDSVPSTATATSMAVLDRRGPESRSNGPGMGPGIAEQDDAVPDGRAEGGARLVVSRAIATSEGLKNGSSLRKGTRARKRVAALWSKLRAIAYIASLQVGDRVDDTKMTNYCCAAQKPNGLSVVKSR